jgi:hypothetical protein
MCFSNRVTPLAWIVEKTKVRKSKRKKERSKKIRPNSKPHAIIMATWWKIRSQGRGKKLKGGRDVFVEGIENNYRIFRLLPKSVTVTIWLVYYLLFFWSVKGIPEPGSYCDL